MPFEESPDVGLSDKLHALRCMTVATKKLLRPEALLFLCLQALRGKGRPSSAVPNGAAHAGEAHSKKPEPPGQSGGINSSSLEAAEQGVDAGAEQRQEAAKLADDGMAAADDGAGSTASQESETTEALQAGLQLNVNAVHEHRSVDMKASS